MRLDRFEIESFGALENLRGEDLGRHRVLVLLGDNESGKSTFLEFLATMLYGFSPADRADHCYAPWNGAPLSGRAGFTLADGSSVAVARRLRHAPEGALTVSGATTTSAPDAAAHPAGNVFPDASANDLGNRPLDCVGPVTRAHFDSFHALALSGLATLDDAAWKAVEERLLGGCHLPALRTAREAAGNLDERAAELWRSEARGASRHRRLSVHLRRLERERAAAAARQRRQLVLRELLAGKAWHIAGTLQRAERLLPVLRGLQEIEQLRRQSGQRLAVDDLPEDAPGRLSALRASVKEQRAAEARLDGDISGHEKRATLSLQDTSILAVEQEIRALVGEAAVHHQDLVHLNDLDRARDAQEALFAERAAQVFSDRLDPGQRETLSRLPMAELASRVKLWEDSRRLPELAQDEVRQAREATHVCELDFEAVPNSDAEKKLRAREALLRELQGREDVLDALKKDIEASKAPGAKKDKPKGAGRRLLAPLGLFAAAGALGAALVRTHGAGWMLLGPVAAALAAAGVVVLRRKPEVVVLLPDEARAKAQGEECARLRAQLGLHEFETVASQLGPTQQGLAHVAARPELERRLVAARQRTEDCVKRVSVRVAERAAARAAVTQHVSVLPIAPGRLEQPGQDLYNDLEELRAVLREMTRLLGEREAVARRAREREARGGRLAESLEMVLPGNAMDSATLWLDRLQTALGNRRRAEESTRALPGLRESRTSADARRQASEQELSLFERRLSQLDFEGRSPEAGLRWLDQARQWLKDADALERALHERFPDWKERGEEGRAALAVGETLDLSTEQRVALVRNIEQTEGGLATLAGEQAELMLERAALSGRRDLCDLDGAIASAKEQLHSLARRRDRMALLAGLVREAEARYRERFQSPVLTAASAHLRALTGGRWERLEVERTDEAGAPRLFVKRADMPQPVAAGHPLSRGLREQLQLSLRLALADQMDGGQPLPLVLDDVLVNWDAARSRQGVALLAELGARRQVVVLTCHAELAEALRTSAGAHVLALPAPAGAARGARGRNDTRSESRGDTSAAESRAADTSVAGAKAADGKAADVKPAETRAGRKAQPHV